MEISSYLLSFTEQLNWMVNKVLPAKPDSMLFCSLTFLLFFAVVFGLYWSMPWPRARVWLLLVASFYFYASWNKWLALLICITTLMDYVVARAMDSSQRQSWRRFLLLFSLVINLGLLCYFKYANFFLDSIEASLREQGAMNWMRPLWIILPVGISFYTFEAINYTVDVFRRKVPAERNLANFMLFITFFPHLVAGPIVRARDFLPQIYRRKHWDWARLNLGAQYFLMGLFKKLAIADRMAMFADPVFANPENYNTGACWVATLAYAIQIYCDFSGYTDMAIGIAHAFGYKLAQNFNMPYIATSIAGFWHRWHMSLSTWLRDYLFIPLGGSRGSKWQTARNLMITMTLGGLWHGANWTFVLWGVLHGALLVLHRWFSDFCKPRPRLDAVLQSIPGTLLRGLVTILCVSLLWIFFRSQTFAGAATMFQHMFVPTGGLGAPLHNRSLWVTLGVMILCHIIGHQEWFKRFAVRIPAPVMGFSYAVVLTVSLLLAPDSGKAFIYFQF
jgi:alginate O-acetyltransferase complex protein AlgI